MVSRAILIITIKLIIYCELYLKQEICQILFLVEYDVKKIQYGSSLKIVSVVTSYIGPFEPQIHFIHIRA